MNRNMMRQAQRQLAQLQKIQEETGNPQRSQAPPAAEWYRLS